MIQWKNTMIYRMSVSMENKEYRELEALLKGAEEMKAKLELFIHVAKEYMERVDDGVVSRNNTDGRISTEK